MRVALFWVSIFLTVGAQIASATEELDRGDLRLQEPEVSEPYRLSLPVRLTPQLGVSAFQYSGEGAAKAQASGGATIEIGDSIYKVETGALYLRSASEATWVGQSEAAPVTASWLAIPVWAKARVYATRAQSWHIKAGAMQILELTSSRSDTTNKIDVLTSIGAGMRLPMTHGIDLVIEATFNRGLLPALRRTQADVYNQGVLATLGLSFAL